MRSLLHVLSCGLARYGIPALPIDEIEDRLKSISINRLILIIDDQSIKKIFVTF